MKIVLKISVLIILILLYTGIILSAEYLFNLNEICYKTDNIRYEYEQFNSVYTYKIDSMIIRDEIKSNTLMSRYNDEIYLQELPSESVLTKTIGDIIKFNDILTEDDILAEKEGRIINIVYENEKTVLHLDLITNYEFVVEVDFNKIYIVKDILQNQINSIKISGKELVNPIFYSYEFNKELNKYLLKFRFDSFYEIMIDKRPITITFIKDIYRNQLVFPEDCIKKVDFNQTYIYAERVVFLDEEYTRYMTEEIKIPIENKINDYYIVPEGYYLNYDFIVVD